MRGKQLVGSPGNGESVWPATGGKGQLLIGIVGLVNSPAVISGVLLAMVVEYQQKIGKQKGEVRLSWLCQH